MPRISHAFRQFANDHYRMKKFLFGLINTYPFYLAYDRVYKRQIAKELKGFTYPATISIETFNLCNFKCIMCPYKDMTREKTTMPMELFGKIVREAKAMGMKTVILSFYNEPFLDQFIFERIGLVKDAGMEVMFYSNGSVLNEEKLNLLLACPPTRIIFSFDGGTKETYERIRVNAKFDVVTANIRRLVEERNRRGMTEPRVEVNCTIQKDNYHEIEDFKRLWDGVVDAYDFGIVDNREGTDHKGSFLDVKASKIIYPCRRLWNEIIVLSSGKVALCCIDFDGKVVLGDTNEQTLEQIWNSQKFATIRKLHLESAGDKIGLCAGCDKLHRAAQVAWW